MNNRLALLFILTAMGFSACTKYASQPGDQTPLTAASQAPHKIGELAPTPTPDPPHALPTLRTTPEEYKVQVNDTIGEIAMRHGVSLESVLAENKLEDPNMLKIGQSLMIPAPKPQEIGPSFKIIPDSELVFSPSTVGFNVNEFAAERTGYLGQYSEKVDGKVLNGSDIVERVSRDYSVNPRLLLALLDYSGGWVTNRNLTDEQKVYPLGFVDSTRKGLYKQLVWAADNLNKGYYLWKVNGLSHWIIQDGTFIGANATINAGTAAIQYMLSLLYDLKGWERAVSPQGFFASFSSFFGIPFEQTIDPLLPPALSQPEMQLPFEKDVVWSFTGGPHGGWGDGSGWAALDFAPPVEEMGCVKSDAWAVAIADGLIVRSDSGSVVIDLDGDGLEQTGWTILYGHIEDRDRVTLGTQVKRGDRIGHPSCEGGVSTGTHLHLARRYNGEWIPADGPLPFNLDGWVSSGSGIEYDGRLTLNDQIITAWNGRKTDNQIQR